MGMQKKMPKNSIGNCNLLTKFTTLDIFYDADSSLPLDRKREMVRKFGQKGTY
jgi:hypothetical protein